LKNTLKIEDIKKLTASGKLLTAHDYSQRTIPMIISRE